MAEMENFRRLARFLKENDAFLEYQNNRIGFVEYLTSMGQKTILCEDGMFFAFPWEDSNEGPEFWSDLNNKRLTELMIPNHRS